MGRANTEDEHNKTLEWATNYSPLSRPVKPVTLSGIKSAFGDDLRSYFALSALSRSQSARDDLVNMALDLVFRVRTQLEQAIVGSIEKSISSHEELPKGVFSGEFFGISKKQGISVRFALSGCQPTRLCAAACYAHDALDASPNAVIRGALNHFVATLYQNEPRARDSIIKELQRHTRRAVSAAIAEADDVQGDWERDPRIRFAHVGEASAYPDFCNALARQIRDLSNGEVKCIVYTRHKDAYLVDPDLFVINFTLDNSSEDRRDWIPQGARTVFSAFGGEVSPDVSVNFLEHHRWSHVEAIGEGKVCPTTLPETKIRACDAVKCDLCFRPAESPALTLDESDIGPVKQART